VHAWQTGRATFYANKFAGRRTASGERLNQRAFTAAHRTLPFGTRVRVVHKKSGKSIIVRITDRGPHVRGCVIDLTRAAAKALGITKGQGGHLVILEPLPQSAEKEEVASGPALPVPSLLGLASGSSYRPDGKVAHPSGFGVQVASYFCGESALYDAAALAKAGFADVYVQVHCTEKQEALYRVLVGQYRSRDDARAARTRLLAKGWDGVPASHM
jgi:rare lipoprotein A